MIKGQTVDLTFNMPSVTVPLITKARVTLQQRNLQIVKENDVLIREGEHTIIAKLTQEDTLSLVPGIVEAQIKLLGADGQTYLSNVYRLSVEDSIDKEVIL